MHAFASPPRRRRAAIVSLLALALVAFAVWAATRSWVEPSPAAPATHAPLTALDDLAAAAEARITLASLRSALDAPAGRGADGPHARRALAVLGGALEARRERSARWEESSAALQRVVTLEQAGDGEARTAILELDEALRTFSP